MCIAAHPDDETLGAGGTLAKYAREGVETYVVTATRGEAGRHGASSERPPAEAIGRARECEERAATEILGVQGVWFLGCSDGEVDRADPCEVIRDMVALIRRVRPQVLVTLPPYGSDGHPDHVAVSQLATAAVLRAADMSYCAESGPPHVAAKLYFMVWTREMWDAYQAGFGLPRFMVDGTPRMPAPWPDWAVTTVLDTSGVWRIVWDAVQCHRSQLSGLEGIALLDEADHRLLWGVQRYYRALSLVNGGRARERDLFEGLR
jgi:N-acetyl-1-D-myo-inositol-2-amino-2-deoxy-alpha-D-glucopyranoside deacetylase